MAMTVPLIRDCRGSADADCGRPHWAYDGDSFMLQAGLSCQVGSGCFWPSRSRYFWSPCLCFLGSLVRGPDYIGILVFGGLGFSVAVASFSLFFGLLLWKWTGAALVLNKIIKINKALRATSSGLWWIVLRFLGDSCAGLAGSAGSIGLLAFMIQGFCGLLVEVSVCW